MTDPAYLADLIAEGVGEAGFRAAAGMALLQRSGRSRWPSDALGRLPTGLGLRSSAIARWGVAGALFGALVVLGVALVGLWTRPTGQPPGQTPLSTSTLGADRLVDVKRSAAPATQRSVDREAAITVTVAGGSPCGARAEGAVAAANAGDHVGTYQAVEFTVVKAKDTGRVTFLNSHDPYQGHFYVAVFPGDYDRFDGAPAALFGGKCIVVRGTIELYRGTPQIVLRDPGDVRILGAP